MSDLQVLSRTVQDLQLSIGRITSERTSVDRVRANCQVQINRLRNIQAGLKSQATPGAQKLRVDLTMWENRFRSATTQFQNLTQRLETTVNQRKNAQGRLEQMQEVRRRQAAAMAARGRGRGRGRGY